MAAGQSSLDDLREAMTALAAVDLVLEMADISPPAGCVAHDAPRVRRRVGVGDRR
jgi:hypothetical protein